MYLFFSSGSLRVKGETKDRIKPKQAIHVPTKQDLIGKHPLLLSYTLD